MAIVLPQLEMRNTITLAQNTFFNYFVTVMQVWQGLALVSECSNLIRINVSNLKVVNCLLVQIKTW